MQNEETTPHEILESNETPKKSTFWTRLSSSLALTHPRHMMTGPKDVFEAEQIIKIDHEEEKAKLERSQDHSKLTHAEWTLHGAINQ